MPEYQGDGEERDRGQEKVQEEDMLCGPILRCAGTSAVGQQEKGSEPRWNKALVGLAPKGEPAVECSASRRGLNSGPAGYQSSPVWQVGRGRVQECYSWSGMRCHLPQVEQTSAAGRRKEREATG